MECISSEENSIDSPRYERISLEEDEGELPLVKRKDAKLATILDEFEHQVDDPQHVHYGTTLRDRVKLLLDGTVFQATMASCILLNAAVIGGETDYPELKAWHLIENAFLLIFAFELLLRMFAVGVRDFFARGGDQTWNLFDFFIVALGVFDIACEEFGTNRSHHDHHDGDSKDQRGISTLFRMIRLLRVLRVFKIVRFVKQLYMIFFGFIEAIEAVCLVSALMFVILYVCSVIMVRTYGHLGRVHPSDETEVLATQFKSIKTSMLSLFELMANPGNLVLYHSLMKDYTILTMFLITFVIFGSFGMVALLTGVISESMFDKNQARVQELRQERESKRDVLKQKCHELFHLVEVDDNKEATPKDLEDLLPYVREMFEKLDIEYMQHEFENIISICDIDDTGGISESEFVAGIMSLCDGVRAASIQEVYYLVSQMNAKVTKVIPRRMESIYDEVRRITKEAIPELQGEILKIVTKMEAKPQLPSTHALSDTTTPQGNSHLPEENVSMASRMDRHTELISRKIDDLTANLKQICNGDYHFNGHEFTLPETQMISTSSAVECKPVSSEVRPSKVESSARGQSVDSIQHNDNQRIAASSKPYTVAAASHVSRGVSFDNIDNH